jgi:hypothetical protein
MVKKEEEKSAGRASLVIRGLGCRVTAAALLTPESPQQEVTDSMVILMEKREEGITLE